jgi:hypothetical protein
MDPKNAAIPTETFDYLLDQIRLILTHPNNRAAQAMARIALSTLREYSPTRIKAVTKEMEDFILSKNDEMVHK